MKVLGLIPARGGSKGIPDKNLRELAGKPLLRYVAEAVKGSNAVDRLVLSTDSERIADLGRTLDIEVPFLRPADLAQDESPMLGVVQHAVNELDKLGWKADVVVLLQPTSPLRRPERIAQAVDLLKTDKADSVVSVIEIPKMFAPQKALKLDDGYLRFWTEQGQAITRRQQLEKTYAREGTVYACKREVFMERGTLYGERCMPLVVTAEEALSLDTMEDWQEAEGILGGKH
jgi:CMP-N-acetylneuraminic acid synthetase